MCPGGVEDEEAVLNVGDDHCAAGEAGVDTPCAVEASVVIGGVSVVVSNFGDVVDVTDVVNPQAAGVVGLVEVVAAHHRVVVDGG